MVISLFSSLVLYLIFKYNNHYTKVGEGALYGVGIGGVVVKVLGIGE